MTNTNEDMIPPHADEEWQAFRAAEILTLTDERRIALDSALMHAWEAGEDIRTALLTSFPAPGIPDADGPRLWFGAKDDEWFRAYSHAGEDMQEHRGEPTLTDGDVIRYADEADRLRVWADGPSSSGQEIESTLDRIHGLESAVLAAPMNSMDAARATVGLVGRRGFLTDAELADVFAKLLSVLTAPDAAASKDLTDAAGTVAGFEVQEQAALDEAYRLEDGGETDHKVVNEALYALDRRLSKAVAVAAGVQSMVPTDHRHKAQIVSAALSSGTFDAHGLQSDDSVVTLLKSLCADLIAAT